MTDAPVDLRRVVVRPILADEREAFDRLLIEQHYLRSAVLVGEALRYVATVGTRWLALLGWSTAAFKCRPRDAWLGWPERLQWRRLRLVANNSRFLVLPETRQPHLASRVLGLSCRRLSRDWQAAFGHPVLLAETFVERDRFLGTCYRAAGWLLLGETKGFGRRGGKYYEHGVRKRILIKPLHRDCRALLSDPGAHPEWNPEERGMDSLALHLVGPGSLFEALRQIPDPRDRHGCSYRESAGLLTLMIAAVLAGRQSYHGIADWVLDVPEDLLRSLGCVRVAETGRCRRPSEPTIRRLIQAVDGAIVDQVLAQWARKQGVKLPGNAIAIDGKSLRGSHGADAQQQVHLVAAFTHREGVVVAQEQVADKSNEIPAARAILSNLDLEGVTVTLDAMHTQVETAALIVKKNGDYILTVKDNQPTLAARLVDEPWMHVRASTVEENRGHGRIEKRSLRVRTVPADMALVGFPDARQMIMIIRERRPLNGEADDPEVVFAITSLSRADAPPQVLAELVRNHWFIENKLHYVRDVTYDEDRSRVRTGSGPRVMASLRNVAIAIHRLNGATNIRRATRLCCQNSRRGFVLLCGRAHKPLVRACA